MWIDRCLEVVTIECFARKTSNNYYKNANDGPSNSRSSSKGKSTSKSIQTAQSKSEVSSSHDHWCSFHNTDSQFRITNAHPGTGGMNVGTGGTREVPRDRHPLRHFLFETRQPRWRDVIAVSRSDISLYINARRAGSKRLLVRT